MDKADLLIVTDNNLETVGGEQESTKIILDNLKNDFNLAVFQPGPLKLEYKGIEKICSTDKTRVKIIVKNPFLFISHVYLLYKTIKKLTPEIIHTQAQVSFFIVSLLKKFKLINKNIKIIHTERGLFKKYNNIIKRIFLFFINELDTLVTTTKYNNIDWKNAVQAKGIGINYKIIPNTAGKLFESYDVSKERRNDDTFVVGFSGRYTDWKNWPLALNVIDRLNSMIGDKLEVRMTVGALDSKSESETKKMFNSLKEKLGNRFVGEMNVDLHEMDSFYYELDLFVLTSKPNTESFGRTLIEAMSRKTAVLTTNAGGSEEVVGDSKNICYNIEDIVERSIMFVQDDQLLSSEKEKNFLLVKEKYSLDINTSSHLEMYQEILNLNNIKE